MSKAHPAVYHLVISLAPGGLERLVVDWTNARNRCYPASTRVVCLDELGVLADQVENNAVMCVEAKRSRFPWDREAVGRIVGVLEDSGARIQETGAEGDLVIHTHNLVAWQYGVLAKAMHGWRRSSQTTDHRLQTTDRRDVRLNHKVHEVREVKVCGVQTAFAQIRLIYTQHGANVHNMRLRDRVRARVLAFFTDEIVAVSEATAEVMAKTLWISRSRIKVIPNGIEVGKFEVEQEPGVRSQESGVRSEDPTAGRCYTNQQAFALRAALGIPTDAWVIGSVGRLAYVKGCDRLIAAFAAINRLQTTDHGLQTTCADAEGGKTVSREAHSTDSGQAAKALREERLLSGIQSAGGCPNNQQPITNNRSAGVFLLLVGDGPERANLERQARELGVADRVVFVGYQSAPLSYLEAMDLFVLPSRSEGLSVSLLEAMAAGVPVAVTDVGANKEVVDGGLCGIMLSDDEEQWSEVLYTVMKDKAGTAQRAQSAQQRVCACYSLDATLDGYERLYQWKF
jgi:glycosyltransferase involved in cell wall biosynthesis